MTTLRSNGNKHTDKVEGLTPHVFKVETKVDGSFFLKNKNINGNHFKWKVSKGVTQKML